MYTNPYHKKSISNLNFLVTGGAGFIGSHLVEYLLKFGASKVRVLDNIATGQQSNINLFASHHNYEWIDGDIRKPADCEAACKGIDIVLHQAALGSVPRSIKDPQTTNAVNIDGFLNMLVAARNNKVQRFVFASSSSVYGDHPALPKVEQNIGKQLSPYAVSKYTNELYANVFAQVYDMEIIGLRYFNIFGPRQSPKGAYAAVIPLFINNLLHQKSPTIHGDGLQTRDFTFVENAVQANICAALTENQSALNQVYNVAVGENFSLLNLVEKLNKIVGTKISASHVESRSGDIRNSLADINKANQLLGYNPLIRFDEGLAITVNSFKAISK